MARPSITPLVTAYLAECLQRMQVDFFANPQKQHAQILRAALNLKIVWLPLLGHFRRRKALSAGSTNSDTSQSSPLASLSSARSVG